MMTRWSVYRDCGGGNIDYLGSFDGTQRDVEIMARRRYDCSPTEALVVEEDDEQIP